MKQVYIREEEESPEEPEEETPVQSEHRGRFAESAAFTGKALPMARPAPTPIRGPQASLPCQLRRAMPVIPRSELVKGYEYEKGRYVTISKEDLEKITPQTAREMQILEFVKLAEVDPIYFETSYYVTPEKAGERAYALLFEALRKSGYVASRSSRCTIANTWWSSVPVEPVSSCIRCSMRPRFAAMMNIAPIQAVSWRRS